MEQFRDHYESSEIEPIDIIQDLEMGFCQGNALKYIIRAGTKEGEPYLKDLQKAYNYSQGKFNWKIRKDWNANIEDKRILWISKVRKANMSFEKKEAIGMVLSGNMKRFNNYLTMMIVTTFE